MVEKKYRLAFVIVDKQEPENWLLRLPNGRIIKPAAGGEFRKFVASGAEMIKPVIVLRREPTWGETMFCPFTNRMKLYWNKDKQRYNTRYTLTIDTTLRVTDEVMGKILRGEIKEKAWLKDDEVQCVCGTDFESIELMQAYFIDNKCKDLTPETCRYIIEAFRLSHEWTKKNLK
jgi:hypothetical protein